MPETYGHTLIPERIDFAPQPQQVTAFLDGLVNFGAAPLRPTLRMGRPGYRTGVNLFTRETLTISTYRYTAVGTCSDFSEVLVGLDDYNAQILGEGPPSLPPFALWLHDRQTRTDGQMPQSKGDGCTIIEFDSKQFYGFFIQCCLRRDIVSTSDRHDSEQLGLQARSFARGEKSQRRLGVFHHPCTKKVIEVPNAGCARFWIEFEFGKWLFPKIEDSLNLLAPSIVELAKTSFGTNFVQGCYWYE